MLRVTERTGGKHETREAPLGETGKLSSSLRCIVLECNCRARLVLGGGVSIGRWGLDHLQCGVCGETFVVAHIESDARCEEMKLGTSAGAAFPSRVGTSVGAKGGG